MWSPTSCFGPIRTFHTEGVALCVLCRSPCFGEWWVPSLSFSTKKSENFRCKKIQPVMKFPVILIENVFEYFLDKFKKSLEIFDAS